MTHLVCPTHGHVGDDSSPGTPVLRGLAHVWTCPECGKVLLLWALPDAAGSFVATYPEMANPEPVTATTEVTPAGLTITVIIPAPPPIPDWTERDAEALALMVRGGVFTMPGNAAS